jgi:hypothetical protein
VYDALQTTNASYRRLNAFATCGSSWWVLESRTRPGTYKLARDYCHDRWCVACAQLRAATLAGNLLPVLRDRPARLITLTVRSADEPLAAQVRRIYVSFRRLRRLPIWTNHVTGGLAVLEITRNPETQLYHPHLHIIAHGTFVPRDALADEWLRCTGDSHIIDVRYVNNADGAVKYVTKYLTKPIATELYRHPAVLAEAIEALRGVKQIITFGTWRKLKLLSPLTDDAWRSLGHWHELQANAYDRHSELVAAILRSPMRATSACFTLADLDATLPQQRPP